MRKNGMIKRSVLLAGLVVMSLTALPVALAQEGEAAAEAGLLTPLGINSGLLFVQTFNFILIAVILAAVLWRPAVNALDARSAKIQKGLEDAAAAAKARQNAEQEAEKILAAARAESAKEVSAARERGDELAKQLQAEARAEAEKIRSDAKAEAAVARDAELAGLRDQVLSISTAVASRIIGENLDAKKQQSLVSEFFTKLPEGAKNLGSTVEVVSAMPLSEAEQGKIRKDIGAETVSFSVDPSILGGVILRSQERVVDGSVRSNLNNLSGSLK